MILAVKLYRITQFLEGLDSQPVARYNWYAVRDEELLASRNIENDLVRASSTNTINEDLELLRVSGYYVEEVCFIHIRGTK